MSRLFIAEKPNMAKAIAAALGNPVKKQGYYETNQGNVTWLYGHILRQAEPQEYDPKFKTWDLNHLPILPSIWKLVVSESAKEQFKVVKEQINQCQEIIHAGDPDREGQLLVDEVLEYVGTHNKKIWRLLIQALDEKSIRQGLGSIQENNKYKGLKNAALCRQRMDWLVGMNLSRMYTLISQRAGHNKVYPVGRVKTPTMALVVRREEEIENFKPVDYFTLKGFFKNKNDVTFIANWRAKENQKGLDSENRLVDPFIMRDILQLNNSNRTSIITNYDTSEKKESQRRPFSLSTLQVYVGKKFGYDPQETLDLVQKLYEKQYLTYPRSDCEALPTAQYEDSKTILYNLQITGDDFLKAFAENADPTIKSNAWNDDKVTAHHAIIPTTIPCNVEKLSENERNIYITVSTAYIAQFWPEHRYMQTVIDIKNGEYDFRATGKTVIEKGWKALYKSDTEKEEEEEPILPLMAKGETVTLLRVSEEKKRTKPPARFTPATLVEAMKNIHKYVQNEDMKKTLKDVTGIGTEATRAGIIDELISKKFMTKEKKHLIPTPDARQLMKLLPEEITYPDSTAIMEEKLSMVQANKLTLEDTMNEQIALIQKVCQNALQMIVPEAPGEKCPKCQNGILRQKGRDKKSFWGCSNFPECKVTFDDNKGNPLIIKCQKTGCKGVLQKKKGPKGFFWGCTEYPNCRETYNDEKGKPVMVQNNRKEGK